MFSSKTYNNNLRTSGTHSLVIPRVNATRYAVHFLPNTSRSLPTVAAFKSTIRNLEFDTDCCPFCTCCDFIILHLPCFIYSFIHFLEDISSFAILNSR